MQKVREGRGTDAACMLDYCTQIEEYAERAGDARLLGFSHYYKGRTYYLSNETGKVFEEIGEALGYLEQSGQKEDTLVIFHSDHGENLGDHGMYLKGPYFYENNVHVPLIISWPGKIPGGRKSKALIELADLAPTICEAAGLPLYEGFQGKSFWKILTGESDLNTHRDSVYSEFYNSNINHRNPLAFTTMVCDGRYKLTKVHGCTQGAEGELYDLQEKPLERYNYYNNPAFTEIKVRMLELLADRMAQTCDPLPTRKACW